VNVNDLLVETFDRLPPLVRRAVDGLTPDELSWAPAPGANSIGWLVWHLTRIQDDHLADVIGAGQVYTSGDWDRFGREPSDGDTGYGHSAADVASVRVESAHALLDYFAAVSARTKEFLAGLKPEDLDRIVDDSFTPPVSLGVRLVSVANDDLQHVGQAAYLRNLLPGRA
jgi:hypothetical protein